MTDDNWPEHAARLDSACLVPRREAIAVVGKDWMVPVRHDTLLAVRDRLDELDSLRAELARVKAERDAATKALVPVLAAAKDKTPFWEPDYNLDAHVEITLTVAECRSIRNIRNEQ